MSSVGTDIQKTKVSKRSPSAEHVQQVALFKWIREMAKTDERFAMAFALPNAGKRSYAMANWYKSEGLEKGILDIFLAVPKNITANVGNFYYTVPVFAGMFIEMKAPEKKGTKNGGLTEQQEDWIIRLRKQGYYVVVCYTAEEAKEEICKYLGIVIS